MRDQIPMQLICGSGNPPLMLRQQPHNPDDDQLAFPEKFDLRQSQTGHSWKNILCSGVAFSWAWLSFGE